MHGTDLLMLLVGSLAITALARRLNWSAPLLLVAVGLAVSYIPGMPTFEIEPDLILLLVLPPLLYSAALDSSYLNIRANLRPIGLLSVGLVLATMTAVGFVAHMLIPGLSLAAAFVLGAVVAPPDAVAAVSIGRKLGLPRRTMTILAGESLANDASALTAFRVALAAATGEAAVSFGSSVTMFLISAVGGIVIGYVLGVVVHAVRMRIGDGVLESALGMLVPFGTYLLAESVHTSGVLAVVVAGLYLGHNAPRAGYATRLQETAVWRSADVLLESLVFALIGLQLRSVITADISTPVVVGAVTVLVVTIVIRFVWMFPGAYVPVYLSKRIKSKEDQPGWRDIVVLSWAGMRGVVSLAAAAAIPPTMPGRNVILFCTFVVTVGTLLIQGLSLPWVIRKLGVRGHEQQADNLAEAQVQHRAAEVSVTRLDEAIEERAAPEYIVERLRSVAEMRGNAAWERLGRQETESPAAAHRRLRRVMLEAEREVFVAARDAREIDDEVLRRVLRELDLEEAKLTRDE
ncbi:Na+/H+ antiporter [Kibdelosporangium phytohabitans]|uniref:Sodium:proton exchanger n=1 Tax=Kibdelosporangium phytohabitans TaxID=860235 RepID=A0A0N9IBC6_9PSEU|nr:sodium:proton exchanger [Kibdelosporangium phytohabitans]MBE1466742.1 CPA1 family monovalent cation:H+ antiporter [Kibdelosporangium phytohabitans]